MRPAKLALLSVQVLLRELIHRLVDERGRAHCRFADGQLEDALGAVECVQPVHHQVTQGVRGIVAPEPVVDRPEGVQSVCTHPYQRRNYSFRGKQPSDICRKNHLRRHRAWSSDQRRVLESSVAASRVTAPPTTLNALPVRLRAEFGSVASPLE